MHRSIEITPSLTVGLPPRLCAMKKVGAMSAGRQGDRLPSGRGEYGAVARP